MDSETNPFAEEEDTVSINPFDEPDEAPVVAPSPQVTEVEEWVEEEVTDDDSCDGSLQGNALFPVTDQAALEEPDIPIGLASEASKQTALHLAVWNRHTELVKIYLDFKKTYPNKLDLSVSNSFDQTPFALSLWVGLDVTDALLQAGSDVNEMNSHGQTLLQQAILHQDCRSAIYLLDRNADFNFRTIDGDSALMLAVRRHLPSVVDALCLRGADMGKPDRSGNVPLWVALETGQEDVASILVRQGCDTQAWHISPGKGYFQTLLHRAIKEKNEAVATFLVRCTHGSELEETYRETESAAPPSKFGESPTDLEILDTPAHMAARSGLFLVLEALIEQGIKVNSKNGEKKTPLHVAIECEQQSCIDILIGCPDLSLSAKDGKGLTPFAYALKLRNDHAANLILQRDPNAAEHLDNRGRSLLHIAVQALDMQSVLFLISKNANVNCRMQDKSDMTPLHVAASSDRPSNDTLQMIMRNLILAGANVIAVTRSVQTSLHLAAERGSHELCSILLENGANPNIQDNEGNTALHLAVKNRHIMTIKRILTLTKGAQDMKLKNARGKTVLHMLASAGAGSKTDSTSIMTIFPLLMNSAAGGKNQSPLNEQDGEGNTMLLLAYMNGHSQLCRALVSRSVELGAVNKHGHSIFTYPAATQDLLHGLLRLVSTEPAWSENDSCLQCGTKFTITLRRHHCRHCGRVLCSSCSPHQTTIPKFHLDTNVRVCDICFHVLKMGGAI